jgi:hypothetical protein
VIRIELTPRLRKTAARLGPEITEKSQIALQRIASHFGNPHKHSGLGLRKLAPDAYEARIGMQWRIVLIHQAESLVAYDIMNHDQVAAWLKGR